MNAVENGSAGLRHVREKQICLANRAGRPKRALIERRNTRLIYLSAQTLRTRCGYHSCFRIRAVHNNEQFRRVWKIRDDLDDMYCRSSHYGSTCRAMDAWDDTGNRLPIGLVPNREFRIGFNSGSCITAKAPHASPVSVILIEEKIWGQRLAAKSMIDLALRQATRNSRSPALLRMMKPFFSVS